MRNDFDRWIAELRDDVIQGEYGHKQNEYTVCPDVWRGLYDRGLTPSEAFRCALDAHSQDRNRQGDDASGDDRNMGEMDILAMRAGETLH